MLCACVLILRPPSIKLSISQVRLGGQNTCYAGRVFFLKKYADSGVSEHAQLSVPPETLMHTSEAHILYPKKGCGARVCSRH